MTINDLRIDIIAAVSQLTDVAILEKIREDISASTADGVQGSDIWKGAESHIRTGVSFDQLMKEQQYRPISYREFTEDPLSEQWEVSLDTLLSISNTAA